MGSPTRNEYLPDVVSPPGATLRDIIEDRGISQADLAARLGRPKKTINEIIKGKTEVTHETALQLERALGVPASFWNNREAAYRDYLARQTERVRLKEQMPWLREIPVADMIKKGWIEKRKDRVDQLREVLAFFGVASPKQWHQVCEEPQTAFRRSASFQCNPGALAAWLRKGELLARKIRLEEFNKETFKDILGQVRPLTMVPAEVFHGELVQLCSSAGVAVVFVQRPPKVPVNGATRWIGGRPLIQLSLRYKTDDQLWFTFFHEAGHILKHRKRDTYIDGNSFEGKEEEEANKFATETLIPADDYRRLRAMRRYTKRAIKDFADVCGISAGIVVGRLQHDGLLPQTHLNGLKRTLDWMSCSEFAQ